MMEACNTQTPSPVEKTTLLLLGHRMVNRKIMRQSFAGLCTILHDGFAPLTSKNHKYGSNSEKRTLSSGGNIVWHEHFLCVYTKKTQQNNLCLKTNSFYTIKKSIGPGVPSMSNSKQWSEFQCLQRYLTQSTLSLCPLPVLGSIHVSMVPPPMKASREEQWKLSKFNSTYCKNHLEKTEMGSWQNAV